jgi:hypothetical protein
MAISVMAGGKPIDIVMPVEALTQLNGLEDPNAILYGSTLRVPYVGERLAPAIGDVSP